jgi:hypothetical protein
MHTRLRVGQALGFSVVATTLLIGLGGCTSTPPRTFDTPEAAVGTLVAAVRAGDTGEMKHILGPQADELISSGDPVADAIGRESFLTQYDQKNSLKPSGDGAVTLEVGDTAWPLPIPVVKGAKGWSFDTAAGLDEMLSRRIGRNELYTIQTCLAIVDAQREYVSADFSGNGWREYARRFGSAPGKKDGLYWAPKEGEPESPLGELVARATEEGYTARRGAEGRRPYHGYLYRILTRQGADAPGGAMDYIAKDHMIGGFAVVAWPADYANLGLKTFITSHHGVVYEKDLGDDTDRTARKMREFNPGEGWAKSDTAVVP